MRFPTCGTHLQAMLPFSFSTALRSILDSRLRGPSLPRPTCAFVRRSTRGSASSDMCAQDP